MKRPYARRALWSVLLAAVTTFFVGMMLPCVDAMARPAAPEFVGAFVDGNGVLYYLTPGWNVDSYQVMGQMGRSSAGFSPAPRLPESVEIDYSESDLATVETRLSGWPLRAFAAEIWTFKNSPAEIRAAIQISQARSPRLVLIPLRIVPLGLTLDIAIWSILWFCVLSSGVLSVTSWRQSSRLRSGKCPSCGYDLKWNLAPGCQECGWRKQSTASAEKQPEEAAGRGMGAEGFEPPKA